MIISEPNKPILQLEDADKDFIKKFISLRKEYQKTEDRHFMDFLIKNYTISKADLNLMIRLSDYLM